MNHQPHDRRGKLTRFFRRATEPPYILMTGYFWPLYSPVIELLRVS
jgi:hypothetical protein